MKISIHNYSEGKQEFVYLNISPNAQLEDVEEELTKLGFEINDIEYMVVERQTKNKLMQMHDYDKDDYLLIVNGNVWAISGNDNFYDIDEVAPPPIPKDAQVMVVKVLTIKKEDISWLVIAPFGGLDFLDMISIGLIISLSYPILSCLAFKNSIKFR